ncbi:SusC/RagA family TonB-linked outer membrane protein [Mangrovibacterium diazotrophicum]|uniref:TonB-linked SusC/RagA family outer membrane protein n=1 Tax=Mangrovibacterium diazotrophicum TaxID=1261403 RepID=A0A419VYN5_9BACT|nr:TonB-dependent receptor [Mangrovibacterium diazotrophicum]RKD88274.1 TonB-linked SusC/RagA family outer membrane protein [Mangrovibacterium diazotrophicum]
MKNLCFFVLLHLFPLWMFAQTNLSGVVLDEGNQPLIGASVAIKGTTIGTVTDLDGKFSLSVPEGSILTVSFIGYQPLEVVADKPYLQIILKEDNQVINDVVVLGYGTSSRKQDLSASVGVIDNTEQLVKRPVASTESMLQGQLAGVTVSATSGDPTSTPSIVIRGQGSQGGDNVLWVVDGIPGAPLASMDDIASIVVLKDAASAAIYGAHSGAGGVILVTTKKAEKGEPTVTYDAVFGARTATNLPQGLNAEQEIAMRTQSYANAGLSLPTGWDTDVNPWIATTRTDWMDAIFRTATYQRHNVALNVGTDSFKHRLSFAYSDDNGTLINTFNKNLTTRYNSSFKLNKWVTITEDFVWANKQSRGTDTESAYSGVILSALYMPRSATVYNPLDGSYGGTTTEDPDYIAQYGSNYSDIHGDVVNPVRTLKADNNYNKISNAWTTTSLEIKDVVQGLKFASRFSYNLETQYYKNFTPIRDEVGKPDTSNSLTESTYRTDALKTENTLTYDGVFGEHNLSALISTTADHYEPRGMTVTGTGFADESEILQYLAYANSISASDYLEDADGSGPDANVSLISRLAYSYNDRYFVTASWRRDYAGRLDQDYNYGDFPAATVGWKISNEKFFKKSDLISLLKFRGSWGRVGNLGSITHNYSSPVLGTQENTWSESGQYGVTAGEIWGTGVYNYKALNPELTWETSEQTDLGVDVDMFRNRLSLSLDYFDKRTFNLIQTQTFEFPSTIGLDAPYVNQGEVRNRGVELQFNWSDKINDDFSYFVSGNFATLKNWVSDTGIKNSDGTAAVWTGDGSWRFLPYMYRTGQGEPLNSYYLVKTDGIFQSDEEAAAYVNADGERIQPDAVAGDLKFVDYDGDGEINTTNDRQYMGNATPDLTYALTLGATYKNLSVSAMLQGVSGAQSLYVAKGMILSDVEGNFNRSTEILNAWSPTNTSSDIPRLSKSDPNGNFSTPSDWYLEDASYLRIKNVTVSYDLTSLITKVPHLSQRSSKMSVYFSGENLATFTKYSGMDPENGGYDTMTYPVSRVLSFGLKLTY